MSVESLGVTNLAFSTMYNSKSKQLYSFSKAARFTKLSQGNKCHNFYDLPSTRARRSTSFGIGGRTCFERRDKSPSPGTYKSPSDFESSPLKGKVYSFGICREAYKKVYIKAHPALEKDIPGPGTYEVREKPGLDAKKFTMRPKTASGIRDLGIPGPGTYEPITATSRTGNQFLSKFKSSGASNFNPPRSKRFPEINQIKALLPGPGAYESSPTLNEKGQYFNSKFKSSQCRTFGGNARINFSGNRPQTPGPGSYNSTSDFHSSPQKSPVFSLSKQQLLQLPLSKCSKKLPHKKSIGLASSNSSTGLTATPRRKVVSPRKKPTITLLH